MRKQVLSLFLALVILVSHTPAVLAADSTFTDISEADWFYTPVQWAVENSITSGLSETTFGPEINCTRGQVVTFLWAAANKPVPETNDNPFADVSESDWFYTPVLWAAENGITGGLTPDSFGPNEPCTRAQVVTFLWASAGKPTPDSVTNPFSDVKESDWFYSPVQWAVENRITNGLTPTTFGSHNQCTRGQIVTFLYAAENPSDAPIETPPDRPEINEKEIYTAYLLNGGYDALTGRNTQYNTHKAAPITILADFDGNGIKDLKLSFTNYLWSSKGYLPEYNALYTIDKNTQEVVMVASYVFDSGEEVESELRYMQNIITEEHVLLLYTAQRYQDDRSNSIISFTEMHLDGTVLTAGDSFRMESYRYPYVDARYADAIESIKSGPHLIFGGIISGFFFNDEGITEDDYNSLYNHYRVPKDPAYTLYNGTYYEPIK